MIMHGVIRLCALVQLVRAYDNGAPHSRLPPLGWSSWVSLGPDAHHPIFDYCDEAVVRHAADAFVSVGLYDAGYRHLHLDDCWAGGRNSSGFLVPEPKHFPNGMKPLVDYVHSKGLTFGLYTCAGTEVCVGGRPGSKDNWDKDAAVFAEWGVDWVKMDWCNTGGMKPADTYPLMSKAMNKTGRPMHLNMCEWGKDAPWEWGPDAAQSWRMSGDHTGTWSSTKSIIQQSAAIPAARTGHPYAWNDMDMLETGNYEQAAHANGRIGDMTRAEYMTEFSMWAISASPLMVTTPIMNCSTRAGTRRMGAHALGVSGLVHPSMPSTLDAGGCRIVRAEQLSLADCKPGVSYGCFSNNASMWTDHGCRAYFVLDGGDRSVLCDEVGNGRHICSPPLEPVAPVSCKGWISDLQKEILLNHEILEVNQDVTPQGRPVKDGDLSVWARHLSDGSLAVALYNQEDTPAELSVDFKNLGWYAEQRASVRDLWAHKDRGVAQGRFPESGSISVAPHSTIMLRLTKTSDTESMTVVL
eukprot:TRINITY_DN16231_c3_g1_i1.p1 TRINITY_DN16231_c3_g1~~TRINITY_DN16231_c3_g1_i1.p1  ORF type:complete len:524 (-),score=61.10 TRINITY_DN16231_c3_g1_i1:210-1781(-)